MLDPRKDIKWETTQKNGIALYFGPYESPAIFEQDPVKKKKLSVFLPTEKSIRENEERYGIHNANFWRFGLGFWKTKSTDNTLITEELLQVGHAYEKPEWLGLEPLAYVGGLDIAFSTGGDECILQLGILGQDTQGRIVLDFKAEELTFKIPILATSGDPAELQIARQVLSVCRRYGMPIWNIALDATGQGRAMGGTLINQAKLEGMAAHRPPVKVYNVKQGIQEVNSFEMVIKTPYDLWETLKKFIESGSVRRVGRIASEQLKTRLIVRDERTNKVKLETKRDYKKRMMGVLPALAHSPDEADSYALCLQAAITNFGFYEGQVREVKKNEGGGIDKYAAWKSNVEGVRAAYFGPQAQLKPSRPEFPKAKCAPGTLYDAIAKRKSW